MPVVGTFRAEFFAQARAARDQLAAAASWRRRLSQKVLTLLADYRAEHRAARRGAADR